MNWSALTEKVDGSLLASPFRPARARRCRRRRVVGHRAPSHADTVTRPVAGAARARSICAPPRAPPTGARGSAGVPPCGILGERPWCRRGRGLGVGDGDSRGVGQAGVGTALAVVATGSRAKRAPPASSPPPCTVAPWLSGTVDGGGAGDAAAVACGGRSRPRWLGGGRVSPAPRHRRLGISRPACRLVVRRSARR